MRLRTILIAIVVVLVGLVVTGYAILKSLDLNDYKAVLAEKVKEATGRDLTLAGDIELEISFKPRLAVNGVSFANAEWGSGAEMATVERLEAQVDLIPLLSSEVRINRFALIGVDILLETDANGTPNWGLPGATDGSAGTSGTGGADYSFAVDEIAIERARVTYRDGATGETQIVAIESLTASAASPSDPIAIAFAGSLNNSPISADGTIPSITTIRAGGAMPIDLTLEGGGATITAKGAVSPEAFDLMLTVGGASLADLGALSGAVLPQLGPYSLAAHVTNPDGVYHLGGLDMKIGESTLTGEASLALGGTRPRITAALQSTLLDLKDFGVEPPAASDGGGTGDADGDGRLFPDDPLPLDALRMVDATVTFTGTRVIKEPVTLENVAADLVLENGRLTINSINAGLAGGELGIAGIIDSSQAPAGVSLQIVSHQVEAGALLQTFVGSEALSGGRVNMNVDVAGSGNSIRQIMASLGGATNFEMGAGQINDRFARIVLSDLFELIAAGGAGGTNLNCVVSRFDIAGGIAESTALVLDTNGATIIGSGEIDLREERPDLRLVPNAKQTNLANLAIPVRIQGTLAEPQVGPDAAALAEGLVGSVGSVGGGVFDVLAGVTGVGTASGTGDGAASDNPCVAALEGTGTADAAPTPSATDLVTEGAEQMLDGAGTAGEGIGQGAGEVLEDAGEALEGLFGN
ncbi:MAG: AsmA family protein [Rhodospirillaceae bacterium]|nr:AsmA family protein [Rhodospirillaceae bacterium]